MDEPRKGTGHMDKGKGINSGDLKQQNRGLILRLIATGECNTRIGLARASRLTKMSVTNIIDEFLEMKLVASGSVRRFRDGALFSWACHRKLPR